MHGTYSFLNVQASIAGPGGGAPLGASNGNAKEGITIEYIDDKNRMTVGADGSTMHSLIASKAGRITIRLLKISSINNVLAGLYNAQTLSSQLHGRNVIMLVDSVRGDSYTCRNVAFAKFPKNDYAEDAGMIEWHFDAGAVHAVLGAGILPGLV